MDNDHTYDHNMQPTITMDDDDNTPPATTTTTTTTNNNLRDHIQLAMLRPFLEDKARVLKEKVSLYKQLQQAKADNLQLKKELDEGLRVKQDNKAAMEIFELLKIQSEIVQKLNDQWNVRKLQWLDDKHQAEKDRKDLHQRLEESIAEARTANEIARKERNERENLMRENRELIETNQAMALQLIDLGDALAEAERAREAVRERLRKKEARILELCLQSIEEGHPSPSSTSPSAAACLIAPLLRRGGSGEGTHASPSLIQRILNARKGFRIINWKVVRKSIKVITRMMNGVKGMNDTLNSPSSYAGKDRVNWVCSLFAD